MSPNNLVIHLNILAISTMKTSVLKKVIKENRKMERYLYGLYLAVPQSLMLP